MNIWPPEVFATIGDSAHHVELILIDDGSTDDTLALARGLAEQNPCIRVLSLSRNFGKEAAILAGLRSSRGDAVIIMDGDLQHPPALIPQLVAGYQQGFDQVLARRTRTGKKFFRRIISRLYYRMVNMMIDTKLEDGVGDFRLMSRRCVDSVLALSETNRFSKGLFSWVGYSSTVVDYENVQRAAGQSGWSMASLLNYGIDGVVSFNSKPLRLAIHLGMAGFSLFVIYLIWIVIARFTHGIEVPGYVTTIAAVTGIGGMQLVSVGIIGEYVGRIYGEVKNRPVCLIAEDLNRPDDAPNDPDNHGFFASPK